MPPAPRPRAGCDTCQPPGAPATRAPGWPQRSARPPPPDHPGEGFPTQGIAPHHSHPPPRACGRAVPRGAPPALCHSFATTSQLSGRRGSARPRLRTASSRSREIAHPLLPSLLLTLPLSPRRPPPANQTEQSQSPSGSSQRPLCLSSRPKRVPLLHEGLAGFCPNVS